MWQSKDLLDISSENSDRFGQVYLGQLDANPSEYQPVEGLGFSKRTLRLYLGKHEDTRFNTKTFSIGVLGQRLSTLIPLGMNPIIEEDVTSAQERIFEMADQVCLIDRSKGSEYIGVQYEALRKSDLGLYVLLTSPGRNILEQDLLTMNCLFTLLDDKFEESYDCRQETNMPDGEDQTGIRKMPYSLLSALARKISQGLKQPATETKSLLLDFMDDIPGLIKGMLRKDSELNSTTSLNPSADELNEWSKFIRIYIRFWAAVRETAIKTGIENGCNCSAYLNSLADIMDPCCLQFSQDWNEELMGDGNELTMLSTMVHLRRITVTGTVYLEAILLQLGISLGNNIRDTTIFKLILAQVAAYFQSINDLFSLDKEARGQGDEWRNNEACILHKVGGLSEENAKMEMASGVNGAIKQIKVLSGYYLKMWKGTKEEENVDRFVTAVINFLDGNTRWYCMVNRYHPDLILDCFINL